jgi:ribosomal protection tetracycline resistance protein
MGTLNLGILAHVDAGKTTLTERLLFLGGAIDRIGSVDRGTTQTDSLALERERGITIKTAVASFAVGDLLVNLIDTPGHPDFIAEVERVLGVLDGAILVVSAAEGVQPQTPLLMRALRRMRVPTLIFVNKIDRAGASLDRTLEAIRRRLTPDVVSMGTADGLGERAATFTAGGWDDPAFIGAVAETLAERDEELLSAYVDSPGLPAPRVREALIRHTRAGTIHPVFAGSAMTGAGGDDVLAGAAELLAPSRGYAAAAVDADGPLAARTFKVERPPSGERVAYVRVFAGALHARDMVRYGDGREGRVTALRVLAPGGPVQRPVVGAGEIAKVSGLADIRVGDALGDGEAPGAPRQFAPPALESVVSPRRPADGGRLRLALNELAEQDPFINVRQDDERHEVSVSLYGEVQKQVIGETLARDYGVEVDFHETTSICIERPVTLAEELEVISSPSKANISGKSSALSTNPWPATVGLRLVPGAPGSGIAFRMDVPDVKLIPIRIFRDVPTFTAHMEGYVREALAEGLHGWQVTDCVVTMIDAGYVRTGTGASDFRRVTEVVINRLLAAAGTQVCEPMAQLRVELATAYASQVMRLLVQLGARVDPPQSYEGHTTIRGRIPVATVHELQATLPGLTGGEGLVETELAGYEPVLGEPPARRRRGSRTRLARASSR